MNRSLVGLAVVSLSVGLLCRPLAEVGAETERRIHLGGGAPQRRALVIGNSAYQAGRLTNPVPDAQAMATVLGELGFDVAVLTDATRLQMREAVRSLRGQLRGTDIGLFYFAGHGVQVEGENYLIPVGAEMSKEEDVEDEAVRAQWVLSALQGRGSGISIMILDACRNNPFARSFRSSTRGLATMRARGGALIAYATGPGAVAADGAGRHSPYTGALVEHLRQPGMRILDVFTAVSQSVHAATGGRQEPWTANSLRENFVLGGSPVPVAQPAPSRPREDVQSADPAQVAYAAAEKIGTAAAYEAVIRSYPDSVYAGLAQAEVERQQQEARLREAEEARRKEEEERRRAAVEAEARKRDLCDKLGQCINEYKELWCEKNYCGRSWGESWPPDDPDDLSSCGYTRRERESHYCTLEEECHNIAYALSGYVLDSGYSNFPRVYRQICR